LDFKIKEQILSGDFIYFGWIGVKFGQLHFPNAHYANNQRKQGCCNDYNNWIIDQHPEKSSIQK